MSSLIRENQNFLSLFLNTSQEQQKALLDTITDSQALLLSEIFLNIINIEHEKKDIKFLNNKLLILEKLSNRKNSNRYRKSFIRKHKLVISKILFHFKDQLISLL